MTAIGWHFEPAVVEEALQELLLQPVGNSPDDSDGLHCLREAMQYAVFGGGKRLRSQLLLEAAWVAGGEALKVDNVLNAACAIELIHAYSLVHDDLPAMDDSDTRRGRPSCHKQYGEAVAILVGDALLTMAFEVMAADSRGGSRDTAPVRLDAMALLARAAGEAGMVGGQMIDIMWSTRGAAGVTGERLLRMHALKTGALIRAACELGALLGGAGDMQSQALRNYGEHLGRAFQIQDDVLDVEGDPELTGKQATDEANQKTTATAVFGLEEAKRMAVEASERAVVVLEVFGDEAGALRRLAHFTVQRRH